MRVVGRILTFTTKLGQFRLAIGPITPSISANYVSNLAQLRVLYRLVTETCVFGFLKRLFGCAIAALYNSVEAL